MPRSTAASLGATTRLVLQSIHALRAGGAIFGVVNDHWVSFATLCPASPHLALAGAFSSTSRTRVHPGAFGTQSRAICAFSVYSVVEPSLYVRRHTCPALGTGFAGASEMRRQS